MEYFKDKFSGNAEEFDSIVVDMFETIKAKEAHHKEAVREVLQKVMTGITEATSPEEIYYELERIRKEYE